MIWTEEMNMKEFLTQHFEFLFAAVALCVFAVAVVRLLKKAKRIDREGLVADAVVSGFRESYDSETHSRSYTTMVRFTDRDGVKRECPMSVSSEIEYEVGQELRIKYLPDDWKMVRPVKE